MSSTTITRRIEFDAGHRVTAHGGKCQHVHGHRYTLLVQVEGEVPEDGMVLDFGAVKLMVGGWVDAHLDHGYLAHPLDPIGFILTAEGHKVYTMPGHLGEPTAENIARLVWEKARELLHPLGLYPGTVTCYETPNCFAEYDGG